MRSVFTVSLPEIYADKGFSCLWVFDEESGRPPFGSTGDADSFSDVFSVILGNGKIQPDRHRSLLPVNQAVVNHHRFPGGFITLGISGLAWRFGLGG